MGDSWLEETEVESISYSKYFERACPVFMSYGLSYEDFWFGDCYKARYQHEAHKLELEKRDEELWEQGMYIYEAILQCAPVLHPFSKEKNPLPYTEKPHLLQIEDKKNEEQKEIEIENERLKAQLWAKSFVKMMSKKN